MQKFPVKFPVALALISAFVAPLFAMFYAGFFAMDFFGFLSVFFPFRTILDVAEAVLFLLFTWGNVYLFYACWKALPVDVPGVNAFHALWGLLAFVAGTLSVLTPLFSVFSGNSVLCILWTVAFSVELIAGVFLGCFLMRIAYKGKNWTLLAVGVAFVVANVFDYSAFRTFETMLDDNFSSADDVDSPEDEASSWLLSLWGISPSEFGTLDDESLANVQEMSLAFVVLLCSVGGIFVIVHSAALVLVYILLALFFAKQNRRLPYRKPFELKGDDLQIC
ncbi:MAG: hypothetical protein M0P13_08570 [Fibrobacteraceae bacterium]|nr:hypothetical protein [Fibrobacteraceae bacterium]